MNYLGGHYRFLIKSDGNKNASKLIYFNEIMIQLYTTIILSTVIGTEREKRTVK